VVVWYIFSRFGILYQEKSGNPGSHGRRESTAKSPRLNNSKIKAVLRQGGKKVCRLKEADSNIKKKFPIFFSSLELNFFCRDLFSAR
jgi:hypothetical protein